MRRPRGAAPAADRRPVDVLLVSLGGTIGLQVADQQLADGLRGAGLQVHVAAAELPREVRTLMLTDLLQARAAARAARAALAEVAPRSVIYSTTTAALLAPVSGAIRFDTLAQRTRPGRHGLWQRPLELRRLRAAPLLLPWDEASLDGVPPDVRMQERLVVPVAIDVAAATGAGEAASAEASAVIAVAAATATAPAGSRVAAVTYASDPAKKGLDRVLAAWAGVRREGELLLVTGRTELPDGYAAPEGVVCAGRVSAAAFPRLVEQVGVYVTAPRREDYGIAQLEAMAVGARVVTTSAPGPYAALGLLRRGWPQQVVDAADDSAALGAALRRAIDAPADVAERGAIAAAVTPWASAEVATLIASRLVPRLLPGGAS